jgi:hypothetical protein
VAGGVYHIIVIIWLSRLIRSIVHLSALEHLHDLLHDRRVHALGLLQLLAIAVDEGGRGLGDAKVLLEPRVSHFLKMSVIGNLTLALACLEMSTMQDLVVLENFFAYLVSGVSKDERPDSDMWCSLLGLLRRRSLVAVDEDVFALLLDGLVELRLAVELNVGRRHVGWIVS